MARGAGLVADDRTVITPSHGGPPVASSPAPLVGLIEARGLGLIRVEAAPPAPVVAVLDLGKEETERLPSPKWLRLCGTDIAWFHPYRSAYFPEAILHYLAAGRVDT
jgi:HPr kinase/phosphorylase